jgi:hypothetical protein
MRNFAKQVAAHYRRQRAIEAIAQRYEILKSLESRPDNNSPTVPASEHEDLPKAPSEMRYQMLKSNTFPLSLRTWLSKNGKTQLSRYTFDILSS